MHGTKENYDHVNCFLRSLLLSPPSKQTIDQKKASKLATCTFSSFSLFLTALLFFSPMASTAAQHTATNSSSWRASMRQRSMRATTSIGTAAARVGLVQGRSCNSNGPTCAAPAAPPARQLDARNAAHSLGSSHAAHHHHGVSSSAVHRLSSSRAAPRALLAASLLRSLARAMLRLLWLTPRALASLLPDQRCRRLL